MPTPKPKYHVTFYQHVGAKGLRVSIKCDSAGNGIPVDEFEKSNLQDEISEIRYNLPESRGLALFTGRFWKDCDGDLCNFWNNTKILRELAKGLSGGYIAGKFGQSPLLLIGTGKNQTVNLATLAGGDWDDDIRSARIVKL